MPIPSLNIDWTGATNTIDYTPDIRTVAFAPITGLPTDVKDHGAEAYASVFGYHGFFPVFLGGSLSVIASVDLLNGTYVGSYDLPIGHPIYNPLVFSPNGGIALCTSLKADYSEGWLEVFSHASGVLTHLRSISLTTVPGVQSTDGICFAQNGTAYLVGSYMNFSSPAKNVYKIDPPYTAITDTIPITEGGTGTLYTVCIGDSDQTLLIKRPDDVCIMHLVDNSTELLSLPTSSPFLTMSPDGLTALVKNNVGAVLRIEAPFTSGSSLLPTDCPNPSTYRAFSFFDNSGFIIPTVPTKIFNAPYTYGGSGIVEDVAGTPGGFVLAGNYTYPVVDFLTSTDPALVSENVTFTDISTGNPIAWAWDFGDGNTSTDTNPIHSFAAIGNYDIELVASYADTAAYPALKALPVLAASDLDIITLSPLPSVCEGGMFSNLIQATGGTAPYTFEVLSGSLPFPLVLGMLDGLIFGSVEDVAGIYTFTILVTDTESNTAQKEFTITVTQTPLMASATLATGEVGVPYDIFISFSNADTPLFTIEGGALPDGLLIDSSTGEISGTPTTFGDYNIDVKLDNQNGCYTTASFSIRVLGIGTPPTLTGTPTSTCNNRPYSYSLVPSGGTPPYVCTVTGGALPAGIRLLQSGELKGTPTTFGVFTFEVTCTDSLLLSDIQTFTLEVFDSPVIQNTLIPTGVWNVPYYADFTKVGGTAPFIWNLDSKLPTGLTFNYLYGCLEGTPYVYGTFYLNVSVIDSNGCSDSRVYTLYIDGPPVISTTTLPSACQNTNYSSYIVVSKGKAPYLWFITSTNILPDALTLNPYTGKISGIPKTPGMFTFSIAVRDSNKLYDEKSYSLLVKPEIECAGDPTSSASTPLGQKPRLISLESAPSIVKDAFHQKYLITYMPTPFIEEDK
jgi:PKD repeat protein